MEIKDYNELNAMHKLLATIKFHEDLDFEEFKIYVGSPYIANVFNRIHAEYVHQSIEKGSLTKEYEFKFEFESLVGKCIQRRINTWTQSDKMVLSKLNKYDFEDALRVLISPLTFTENEFEKLTEFAQNILSENTSDKQFVIE